MPLRRRGFRPDARSVTARPHIPVLLDEVCAAVVPRDDALIVDGTFGAGGYSTALLTAADCRVLAFDRDPTAVRAADAVTARYPNRLNVIGARFSEMAEFLRIEEGEAARADAVVLDIGVSSMQIDQAERGFSFQTDGPLDMRMGSEGPSAADVVNTADVDTLADIFFHLGDERQSRRIARAIVADRVETPFTRTLQLAGLVARVLKTGKVDGRNPATRVFQALRIHVNDELGELAQALVAAEAILKPGGRLVVVTFHSLEDGIVKRFMRERSGQVSRGSRHAPIQDSDAGPAPTFTNVAKPVAAGDAEVAANPRARSARLRSAVRTEAPALGGEPADLGVQLA
jgi:16S rRNA (cytosine1402-N4)-methyltransferase